MAEFSKEIIALAFVAKGLTQVNAAPEWRTA